MCLSVVSLLVLASVASGEPGGLPAGFIANLYDATTGGYRVIPGGPPSLRACNGAAKALKALGKPLADAAKTRAFVMSCSDPAAGAFAEPGMKSDVAINAVGVMAALELGVPRGQVRTAVVTLGKTAKTFEEVRIAAAAVEAFGVKECPFPLDPWVEVVASEKPVGVRAVGSHAAFHARLGLPVPERDKAVVTMVGGQHVDGGYVTPGAAGSDLETTYRVSRALKLLGKSPADPAKLLAFLATCQNPDGGSALTPGGASTMSGTYYAAMIRSWL